MNIALAVVLAVGVACFLVVYARGMRRRRWPPSPMAPPASAVELDMLIGQLARAAWPPKEIAGRMRLNLSSAPSSDLQAFVEALLRHIRTVGPKLNAPMLTPRIAIESSTLWAGQFVEKDGWVKISVSATFQENPIACRAILCHEVCHYVLSASGIRERDTRRNERLTDVAMFVLGLGETFLAGFERRPLGDYRPGHRLGYLSADEYAYVRDSVEQAWARGALMTSAVVELERLLKASIPDAAVRGRLLSYARTKSPNASEAELIESVLDDYRRDRR